MTFVKTLFGAAMIAGATSTAAFSETTLTLLTEEYPPYNYTENGEIVGAATEMLQETFAAAGIGYTMESQPWARAFAGAQKQDNTCVFSTSYTAERADKFKWVKPLDLRHMILVANRANAPVITSLDDAKGLTIGTYQGDVTESVMINAGMTVSAAPKEALTLKMLKGGRVDLWVTFRKRLEDANDPDLVEVFMVSESVAGLACNLGVDDTVLASLQAELDALTASGRAAEISAKYSD